MLLYLWLAAVALIGPLAWELPYDWVVAVKRKKKIQILKEDYVGSFFSQSCRVASYGGNMRLEF